ncbi:MAG TPA: hypothetical protein VFW23_15480 [Tepidisphaeraceae bacterium]|nr:hypothetical protein [Tepidisphaeraceae bacterium]
MAKVIEDLDGFDDAGDGFSTERGDTGSHHGVTAAAANVLSKVVIERANTFGLRE